ncbi:MAG: cation transporter [Flavobacteriales bacterium]|nr:cation transporter [Flavobacteriales bacterium]
MKVIFGLSNAFALAIILMACGNVNNNQETNNKKIETEIVKTELEIEADETKTVANLTIEGMSCEKMCAGLINQKLAGLEGVKACEIDFENKVASVEYDDVKVNEDEMVNTITSLNDGQYSVTKIEVKKMVKKVEKTESNDSVESDETAYLDEDGTSISFFNIFDVISRIY